MTHHFTHAYSARAKKCLEGLTGFQYWPTKDQAENGIGLMQPFILKPDPKERYPTPGTITSKLTPGVTVDFKKTNRYRHWTYEEDWKQPLLHERERLSPSFIMAIAHCEWRREELVAHCKDQKGEDTERVRLTPPTRMLQDVCSLTGDSVGKPSHSSFPADQHTLSIDLPGLGGERNVM